MADLKNTDCHSAACLGRNLGLASYSTRGPNRKCSSLFLLNSVQFVFDNDGSFCPWEKLIFNDDTNDRNERPLIETRLLRCLRTWRVTPDAIVEGGRTLFQEICGLLEFYICGCIGYGPKNLRGWWSDGVIHLEIAQAAPDRMILLGVTWIDSFGLTPFEFDLELDPLDDVYFAKTVFRIGMLDTHGRPVICSRNLAPTRVLEMRPRYNRDWAMAVELTPPLKNAAEESDPPTSPVSRPFES